MEPPPGECFKVDWGHFGALDYAGDKRKLYVFALVEAHSRMLYLELTHSQSFETFFRCHVPAFPAMGGAAEKSPTAPASMAFFGKPATRRPAGKREGRARHRACRSGLLVPAAVHPCSPCFAIPSRSG
jgi:transposase